MPFDEVKAGDKEEKSKTYNDKSFQTEQLSRFPGAIHNETTELNEKDAEDSKEEGDESLYTFFSGYHRLNTSLTRKSSQALYSG